MYTVLSILFIVLVYRIIEKGPAMGQVVTVPESMPITMA
jgi:hypothetical protein